VHGFFRSAHFTGTLSSKHMGIQPVAPQQVGVVHTLSAEFVAEQLGVRPALGLSTEEVRSRLDRSGPNTLREAKPRPAWLLFLNQFKNVLILILAFAAAASAIIGNTKDAIVVCAVILLNGMVGFYQEHRAERSLAALKRMLPVRARVRRNGEKADVAAEEIVPGDIVLVEAGDRIPADGRLVVSIGLQADESALTGESKAAEKDSLPIAEMNAPLADRRNMVFMNTIASRGRAEFIVTATGQATAMGRISEQLAVTDSRRSPLQLQLDALGKRLGMASLILVGSLFVIQLLRGASLMREVMDAIALAVASVPEGLPVVVTVTLALGMRQMAQQGAVIRKMASVETLGCTTIICSDKTGTLTMNQMTVRSIYSQGIRFIVSGEGYRTAGSVSPEVSEHQKIPLPHHLVAPLLLCNDSRVLDGSVIGDPMEASLLVLAAKLSVQSGDPFPNQERIAEIPFDSSHKFMATFHHDGDDVRVWVKGAPDVLLPRCGHWLAATSPTPMDSAARTTIAGEYHAMAGRGMRGLLIATRSISRSSFETLRDYSAIIEDLTFLGLLGLQDPPRPEVRDAIAQCLRAGVAVKMITGDHAETARAVGRELGIEGEALSGAELEALSAAELAAIIPKIAIFSRVAPEHKVRIVQALQQAGHVVAMTGDGVNDAPALKHADIGVAMGIAGTDVSKEAASMILTDDNFATIVAAIRHGRTLYDNIVKFVRFQLSTSMGAVFTIFAAPLFGLPDPFNAIQILWVAMIMDGPPAISLAMDAPRPGIMQEPPRKSSEPILPLARMLRVMGFGAAMMVGTLAVLRFGLETGSESRALTLAFTTFVLFQFFNVFNARTENGTSLNKQFFHNRMLWCSLAGGVLLQFVVVHWQPAQRVFRTVPLSISDWALAVGVASLILLLEEARKCGVRFLRGIGARSAGLALLAMLWSSNLSAAELQSQQAFDVSFSKAKWDVIIHSRFRSRVNNRDFFQFRMGPIFEYNIHRRAFVLTGFYFTRNQSIPRANWATTNRAFAGAEFALVKSRHATLDFRTLAERFLVHAAPDFNRYRERLLVTSGSGSGPYIGAEGLFDRRGLRSFRYSGGWRKPLRTSISLDIGYFFETRRLSEGGNRHMITTALHFRSRKVHVDPDI